MMSIPFLLLLTWGFFEEAITHGRIGNQASKGNVRKSRRFKRSVLYYDSKVNHLCKKCPAGNYVKKSCDAKGQVPVCEPCHFGTYLEHFNYLSECRKCTTCDTVSENLEMNCTVTNDAICVCKKGRYRKMGRCLECEGCKNRQIVSNCSQSQDATCGDCLPGFYESKTECLPCPTVDQNICWNETHPECLVACKSRNPAQDFSKTYLAYGTLLLFLLPIGFFLNHRHRRKKKKESLGTHEVVLQDEEKFLNLESNCPNSSFFRQATADGQNSSNPSQSQPVPLFQKGSVLYDVIDSVPARRWKEFMRMLAFPDKEIELVEIEISSFRDQQYEMLRRWGQLQTTGLEIIYNTLERMNLSGCAEELRQKLDSYT